MPRQLETFSTCAGPGVARSHKEIGGFVGVFISAYYANGALTIVGGVAYAVWLILAAPPWAVCTTAGLVILAAIEFKNWYYNGRLLCIRDEECTIGTVISEPTAAEDGDRKLNLMLAPFTQLEIELALIDHLERNSAMLRDDANFPGPFHTAAPLLPTSNQMLANRTLLKDYMKKLKGSDPDDAGADSNMYNQITIGLVDTMMQDNSRNFYERFYRIVSGSIPDAATLNAISRDFDTGVAWQSPDAKSTSQLNPMFRYSDNPIVPYLHCEIEGNAIAILMDDIITAAAGFVVGCVLFGPLGGLIIGFLAWLFKKLIDWITGNDGNADRPDVDWDDPNFPGYPGVTETSGDVVAVYGHWIMDTEHQEYFEIHPVRAYYLIVTNSLGAGDPVLVDGNEEQVVVGDNFDPTTLDEDMANRICEIIGAAERQPPGSKVSVAAAAALAYGMNTKY